MLMLLTESPSIESSSASDDFRGDDFCGDRFDDFLGDRGGDFDDFLGDDLADFGGDDFCFFGFFLFDLVGDCAILSDGDLMFSGVHGSLIGRDSSEGSLGVDFLENGDACLPSFFSTERLTRLARLDF